MSDPYAGIAAPESDPYAGIAVADATSASSAKPITFKSKADLDAFRSTYPEKAKLSDADFLDWYGKSRTSPTTAIIDQGGAPLNSPDENKGVAKDYTPSQLMLSKVTFGLSDKAQAGVMKLGDLVTGNGRSYDDELARVDAAKAAFKEEHSGFDWATSPLNLIGLAGGAPEALAAKVGGGVMRRAAVTGAGYGALAGAGQSRGSYGDEAKTVALSTLGGAALGPIATKVLPAASAAVGKGVSAMRNAIPLSEVGSAGAPSPAVGAVLLKKLAEQGMTPRQAGKTIDAARENGVPLALMDTGDEMRGLASSLGRKPGPNRTLIRDMVVPRQEGSPADGPFLSQTERIQGHIERDLGPVASVRKQSEALMQKAQSDASPLYREAYANPIPTTSRLQELSNRPSMQAATKRAYGIAKEEGRDPVEIGMTLDKDGNVVVHPVPVEAMNRMDAARNGYDEASAAYERALTSTTAGGKGANAARQAFDKASAELDAAKENMRAQIKSGTPVDTPNMSTQTWDYVKRGLDDVLEERRDPVTRRLNLDEAGRAIQGTRVALRAELDRLNPAYAAARKAYEGPAVMRSALEQGSTIANKDAGTIEAEVRDLTPPELDQYKLGVRSALAEMLEGRVDTANKVKALLGTPKKRMALAHVFGGERNFDRFLSTMAQEAEGAATYARVNLGSQTAANHADDAELSGISGAAINGVGRVLAGHNPAAAGYHLLRDLAHYGAGKSGERLRTELAVGISETDPSVLAANLAAARRAAAVQRVGSRRVAPRIGAGAGVAVGSLVGLAGNRR